MIRYQVYSLIDLYKKDLDTNTESPVTAIVSENGSSSTFVAGFADGAVKVFDRRLEEEDAIVRSYSEHTSWVQNVRWHPTLGGQFLSARFTFVLPVYWHVADFAHTVVAWVVK
jgi:regulator-associated protein of mTOR